MKVDRFLKGSAFLLITTLFSATPGLANPLREANTLFDRSQKSLKQSIKRYKQAAAIPSSTVAACTRLGEIYRKQGKYDLAIKNLQRAIILQPTSYPARFQLGLTYFESAAYTKAQFLFGLLREERPQDPELWYYLARTADKKSLFEEALDNYRKLATQSPNHPLAQQARQHIRRLSKGRTETKVSELTDQEVKFLLKESKGKVYPEAGAVILLREHHYTINEDNTQTEELHYLVKILKDRAKNQGEVQIAYDSSHQSVTVTLARTLLADGTIVEAGEKAMRDLAPWSGFPLYSNAKVKVISMPEVAVGAVLEYKAVIHSSQLSTGKKFSFSYILQGNEPYTRQRFIVTLPEDQPLQYQTRYLDSLQPVIRKKAGKNTYRWLIEDMPGLLIEPNMPPRADILPQLMVSSFSFWQEVTNWFNTLLTDQFELDDQCREKVRELTATAETPTEKVRALFHYVASKIRYVGLEYGESGYKPHRAKDIFLNKYGDCKDQATLLTAMVRSLDIEANIALISTQSNGQVQRKIPHVPFNHCIAKVTVSGKTYWLDPTAATGSFGDIPAEDQGRQALVMYKNLGRFETTPLFTPEQNRLVRTVTLEIRLDESVHGVSRLETEGNFSLRYRGYKYYKPIERERMLKRMVNSLYPGGALLNYHFSDLDDLEVPVTITTEYSGPHYLKRAGNLRIFQLPGIGLSAESVALGKRRYPLFFGSIYETKRLITLAIPPHLQVQYLPSPLNKEAAGVQYQSHYYREGSHITFEETIRFSQRSVSLADYARYKQFRESVALEADQYIVLAVMPESDL